MGFAKKGSFVSLFAGIAVGSLFLESGYLIKGNKEGGIELATASSVILTGSMAPRAFKTRAAMPIGVFMISSLSVVYFGRKLWQQEQGV